MAILKGTTVQSGADTTTRLAIETNLSVDGKSAWSITGFQVYWSNGETSSTADQQFSVSLNTVNTGTLFSSTDQIALVNWGLVNTGGVAVAYQVELVKQAIFFEERLTVQPTLYVDLVSSGTGQANRAYVQIQYEIVKMNDLEVMRMLVGGA